MKTKSPFSSNRQALECASPLALCDSTTGGTQSGRGLPHSKTLARPATGAWPGPHNFLAMLALFLLYAGLATAAPVGSAFLYNGLLHDNRPPANGAPANGAFDLRFRLFNDASAGSPVGSALTLEDVAVNNGLFTVTLDFGDTVFNGSARFLEIGVRPGADTGAFDTLPARQPVLPTPEAIHAAKADTAKSVANGAIGTAQLTAGTPAPGQVLTFNGSALTWASAETANNVWSLTGNSGTTPGTHFLGTTDNNPLLIRAQGGVGIDTLDLGNFKLTVNGSVRLGNNMEIGRSGSHYDELGYNVGFSGVNETYTYVGRDYASAIRLGYSGSAGGGMEFRTAPYSGTRGAPLTLTTRMVLTKEGNVGIGTTSPQNPLTVQGNASTMRLQSDRNGGHTYLQYYANGPSQPRTAYAGIPGNGSLNFTIENEKPGGHIRLQTEGNIYLTSGAGSSVRVPVLTITGGSDLSENFDIAAAEGTPAPGLVVCIDPTNPGKLVRSTKAHDRTVAGIISGANGISTGMMMGQADSVADGKHPVALTGRVYAWADATNGPIQSGDLLTTSDTPGHAMRVTDYAAAQGAIIGKAMTALPEGKGLVLVLVSLQ